MRRRRSRRPAPSGEGNDASPRAKPKHRNTETPKHEGAALFPEARRRRKRARRFERRASFLSGRLGSPARVDGHAASTVTPTRDTPPVFCPRAFPEVMSGARIALRYPCAVTLPGHSAPGPRARCRGRPSWLPHLRRPPRDPARASQARGPFEDRAARRSNRKKGTLVSRSSEPRLVPIPPARPFFPDPRIT